MAGIVCGELDITQIAEDELIAISGYGAWVACDVDEKIYEITGSPYGYAVIKFNSPCWSTVCSNDGSSSVAKSLLMISNSIETTLKTSSQNPEASGSFTMAGSGLSSSTLCGINIDLLKNMQNTTDSLQLNEKGFQPAAVRPNAAVIPMRSNVFTYGPWASSNFATTYGGAELQSNNDLAPWLFGSYAAMNTAGQELANTSIVGLSRAENGSVTVLGLPVYTIGAALFNGPNLTSINTTFGSSGATTTYDFATYTPKFGQLSRAIIEKFKKNTQIRNEQLRFLRQNQIANNKIGRKGSGGGASYTGNTYNKGGLSKSISDKNSLTRVMVGEIYDFQNTANSGVGQRTVVGSTSLSKSVLEMNEESYTNKAFMSLDALYGPVSIYGGGGLPRMIQLSNESNVPKNLSWSISPNPPVNKIPLTSLESTTLSNDLNENNIKITIQGNHINPLANPNDITYHSGNPVGHCIDIVGRNSGVPESGIISNFYGPAFDDKYSADYRFFAMRGPLVLQSWGYDTEGKPVPNETDTDNAAADGSYARNNLKNRFLTDWLQKPATWPVAPIDLRLDRDRGVWVSPKEFNIVPVELTDELSPYGMSSAKLISSFEGREYIRPITDEDGNILSTDEHNIIVEDRIGANASSGNKSYAYFDTFSSKYLLLGGTGSGVDSSIKVGYTKGLWPINTRKAVDILDLSKISGTEITFTADMNQIAETGVYAYNVLSNISRTGGYHVILGSIDNKYFYINGGEC